MAATPISHPRADATDGESSAELAPDAGPPRPLLLFGFECSLETGPLDTLEAVARGLTRPELVARFERSVGTDELAFLRTCHRVELIGLARDAEEVGRWRGILPHSGAAWRFREGREVVRHVFHVASGFGSLAVGETEVRAQVRAAGHSVLSRHPRPVLRAMLQQATEPGGAAGPGARSIASVAAGYLRALTRAPRPRVLIVGAGTVGRQVARALAGEAELTFIYHARPPAPAFLKEVGATAHRLDALAEQATSADAIITAAKLGDHGFGLDVVPRDRPLVLVDLGMPRNIDPAVRRLPNVRLVDLQELYDRARATGGRPIPDATLEERADRCSELLDRWLWEPWVAAVYRAAEATRRSEVEAARPFLGPLDRDQMAAVDRLTRRLVSRLLLPTAERIRSLPTDTDPDRRRLAWELLRPTSSDP